MKTVFVLSFFMGIGIQLIIPFVMPLYIGFLLFFLFPVWIFATQKKYTLYSLIIGVVFFFIFGLFWAAFRADIALSHRLNEKDQQKIVEVTGTVVNIPTVISKRVTFDMDIESIHPLPIASQPPRRIRITWNHKKANSPLILPAQKWRIFVKLTTPNRPYNPYAFDQTVRHLQLGIDAFGTVIPKRQHALINEWTYQLIPLINRLRGTIQHRLISESLPNDKGPIITALSIGDQRTITPEIRQLFARTGTSHLIAISGLHLGIVALGAAKVISLLWGRIPQAPLLIPCQKIAIFSAAVVAVFYALFSGFGLPVQRATTMIVIVCILLWINIQLPRFTIVAQALFFVLLLDPWAPLFPGFWLSFGAISIILATPNLFIASPHFKNLPALNKLYSVLNKCWASIRLQFIICMGMLCLSWWFFNQISIISVATNIIAIPFMTLIITPLALLSSIVPSTPLTSLCAQCINVLINILEWFDKLPYAWISLPSPPVILIVLALTGFFLWLVIRRYWRWMMLISFVPLIIWRPESIPAGSAEVVIFDVGQGNAALIRTASHNVIIDTGPRVAPYPSPAERVILPYLKAVGISTVDATVLSHGDNDHAAGVTDLIDTIKIKQFHVPVVLESLKGKSQKICRPDNSWEWDGVRFDILYPVETIKFPRSSKNDQGCMIKVSTSGGSILFPGDLGKKPLARLTTPGSTHRVEADILLAPHHGSKNSSPPSFIKQVGAKHVIFSAGRQSRYKHPHQVVIENYRETGAMLWYTAKDGALLISLTPSSFNITGMRQSVPRYWH